VYAGSETCAACHQEIYDTFKATGHPVKLRPMAEARAAGVPKPDYLKWEDILFVIGGYRWKARYVGQDGYIITGSPDGKIQGRNQFNLETGQWVNYNAGRKNFVYDCGECHNTGYSTIGNQLRKPGFLGSWALNGVQCEACHGPGTFHARSPSKSNIKIDRSAAACGQCHRRGTDMGIIPAAGGFGEHREQYQEFRAGAHANRLTCVSCHNPHRRGKEIKPTGTCEACHTRSAAAFANSRHQRARVRCVDCHMPNTGLNAVVRSKWEADDPSHLMRINLDPAASQFTLDGLRVAGNANTLEFTCLRCHYDHDKAWAARTARGVHTLGK
jgi:hypothetical protein